MKAAAAPVDDAVEVEWISLSVVLLVANNMIVAMLSSLSDEAEAETEAEREDMPDCAADVAEAAGSLRVLS